MRIEIKYQNETGEWFCFSHAIKRVLLGQFRNPVIDEEGFSSDYDMRDTSCMDCRVIEK